MDGVKFLKERWLELVVYAVTMAFGTGVILTRLAAVEAQAAANAARIDANADKADIAIGAMRDTLGDIQLDVGQLCAASFGADKCYTARRK